MTAKVVAFGADARRTIVDALHRATRVLRPTLGPLGRTVLIQKSGEPAPFLASSGLSVLLELEFSERLPNTIVLMLREAARRQHAAVGDGIVTAIILAEELLRGALRHIEAGAEPFRLYRDIESATARALRAMEKLVRPVNEAALRSLLKGAGRAVESVAERLGQGAAVFVEESSQMDTTAQVVEGLQIPHGFVTAHLVNRKETGQVMMEDPLILVHDATLSDVAILARFLERVKALRRPVLMLVPGIDADPIATLVVNHLQNVVHACPVRARGDVLEDAAAFTGATLLPDLDHVSVKDLGQSRRAVVDSESTTIMGGRGNPRPALESIQGRLAKADLPIIEREALQERAARLSGLMIQIFAGGASAPEMKRNASLARGAVNAVRAAIQGGTVPGAGSVYLHGRAALASREDPGSCIVFNALDAPLAQILRNSGREPRPVVDRIGTRGFDVLNGVPTTEVLDPWPVVRAALNTALSLAGIFLGCEAIVTERGAKLKPLISPNMEEAERARQIMGR